jgi:hypothetical protein
MKTSKNSLDSNEFIEKIELKIKGISEVYINTIKGEKLSDCIESLKSIFKIGK